MRFADGYQAREAIRELCIEDNRQVHFSRVSKGQMQASCKPPCGWRVYCSSVKATGHFIIKTIGTEHTCGRAMRNKQVTSLWIAQKYLNVFRYRPDITVAELAKDIRERYNCHVGNWKLYKAKTKAIDMLRGTVEEHYAKLRSYVLELIRVDREGRFELHLDVGAVFKGFYVGFSALRKGFQAGCRKFIGIDGVFLKTYLGGVLLCAVAHDANNHMFPIAWAVVEVENEDNWSWFLRILVDDLGLSTGAGTIFISDQQKGLMNAVSAVAPMATHRNCARHVYMNWKKSHKSSDALKKIFWRVVRSTYLEEYHHALGVMQKESEGAYENFMQRDTTKFCKCFFDPGYASDMLLNNISETFNGYILTSRGKHIIDMLEEIRISLMTRLHRKKEEMNGYTHRICPQILKDLENIQSFSRYCVCHASSDVVFEVENYHDRFIVDVRQRTCTCRAWDISGIPCIHACAAISFLKNEPQNYVAECYSIDKYHATYSFNLPPLNGEKLWPKADGYPVVPPTAKKMPGRPKKKRKKDPCEENPKNPRKLRKTCSNCKQQGHNKNGCKKEKMIREPPTKGKAGRPRKDPGASTSKGTAIREKKKAGRPKKVQATSATNEASTSKNSTITQTGGKKIMGVGGSVHTHMPTKKSADLHTSKT